MADETFDAVIIGGGNKALLLALYLARYGGLSIGIFERRHEVGGCLATEELSAPGFRGNTHANIILPWYYAPVYRDFPEFWDYGARWEQHLCSDGFVFKDRQNCIAIYSDKHDPTQERTANEIARFSKTDADLWLRLWAMAGSDEFLQMQMDSSFRPAEERAAPEVAQRQAAFFPKLLATGLSADSLTMKSSPLRAAQEWFESPELQSCVLRFAVSAGVDVNDSGSGMNSMGMGATLPIIGFNRGGTHQIAHAAHQILVQHGCRFFTNTEVASAVIEHGTATGIRLTDGTEVAARRLVVSTLSPRQLVFDLIGEERVDPVLRKRVKLLETSFGCIMWYTFAVHEAPRYLAESFNPDIHDCEWLGLQPDPDPMHIVRECRYARLHRFPPLEDYATIVGCHSLVDPSFAPPGKHAVYNEQLGPPVSAYTEQEWFEIKRRYAEELIGIWQEYAPNMTWDNVIGVDTNSPYDHSRMKNLAPDGAWIGVDRPPYQVAENRPTPELANHRTPIQRLYATGGSWHVGSNAGSTEAYNCYRIIARDLGLGKPWEEPGKEEPESLVAQTRLVRKQVREAAGRA